ncbi:MerC family mercury resistance protein [Wenzhouxiangella sp. XN79A]|uniref:MerC family mercury resistance protein n=1 Tax=Wenzhouxiangella sp. XN79A TaxID=2724193 RepID=UPI00144A67D8|nr:MerC family mercury resistance protein [Wenzhouxiangella sp. XN79A]NKI33553.1 MerC family mercury resistance protein [Wenzhouxiangella sp. XN79A]
MDLVPARPARWIDRLGICASVGCGLHCAVLTVVILMYPTLWLHRGLRSSGFWEALWWTELGLLVLAWLFALLAAWLAWRRDRSLLIPGLAIIGSGILTLTIASPFHGRSPWISALALFGGLLVASAHVLNLWRTRRLRLRSP